MITPYDWQESIGNRAQYIEGKLKHGSPVLAVSLDAGILIYTRRRQSRKIFEVYDRLAFSAIGQQSDVESLRNAAVEFAHQEGYNRSEQDVTIQRVVTALSAPVKKAFGDFSSAPLVARSLFVEVGNDIADDRMFVLDYDGDYGSRDRLAAIAGTHASEDHAIAQLSDLESKAEPMAALEKVSQVWDSLAEPDSDGNSEVLVPEAILIDRSNKREDRFRVLLPSP
jgi:proteasome alpha subunit